MKSYRLAIFMIIACMPLYSQSPGEIRSVGGVVEVINGTGSATAVQGEPLAEMERLRTGIASSAAVAVGVNGSILLGEQSEIEIRKLGASPLLWLESGKVRVRSQGADVQIQTKSGLFSAVEWPFEMELTNVGGTVNVLVTEGRVRTQNLDASAVTFGVQGSRGFRSYTAGAINPRTEEPESSPALFVQPCVTPGNNGTGQRQTAPQKPAVYSGSAKP